MEKYNPRKIEQKWQKIWQKSGIYKAKDSVKGKNNFYHLVMFPYPSGDLHIGHWYNFAPADVFARLKKMKGFNVMSPIGFDSFGLPAENAAIKRKIHPRDWTYKNIQTMKKQLQSMGNMHDWSREIITSDPGYYKWTQWMFLQLYKNGLACKKKAPANWCPKCHTVLANEQVINGKCERCETEVVQRDIEQWLFRITKYADKLLEGLDKLDWPEKTKIMQRNWIGRSEGATIKFQIVIPSEDEESNRLDSSTPLRSAQNDNNFLEVFTTRLDTIYGCTYCVVAPEHPFVASLLKIKNQKSKIKNFEEVEEYMVKAQNKTKLERMEMKEKTGVEIKGIKAVNPFNNEEMPIFVADYVLGHYGTGAVMAVPAHDERDWEFAKKYNLPIKMVVCPNYPKPICPVLENAYTGEGHLVGSGEFSGMKSSEAKEKMTKWLEDKKLGGKKINYKLKDWVFSRQRYWGEPIPLIHCENCRTKKALLIHGFEGNGNGHWFLWLKEKLESKGIKVYNPTISAANHPTVESWLKELMPIVKNFGPDDIIIGHSLGANAAL